MIIYHSCLLFLQEFRIKPQDQNLFFKILAFIKLISSSSSKHVDKKVYKQRQIVIWLNFLKLLKKLYIYYSSKMFDADLEEQRCEEEFPQLQLKNQMSTVSVSANIQLAARSSNRSPQLLQNSFENSMILAETSLDRDFYKHNANQIKLTLLAYLKHCLDRPIDQNRAFQDGIVFCFQTEFRFESQQDSLMDILIKNNQVLDQSRKNDLLLLFKQYDQLRGLFREMKDIFGRRITQEFVYILDCVFECKLNKFKQFSMDEPEGLLPRMQRFWDDDNLEKLVIESWKMSTIYDYDEIKKLAIHDIETLGSILYFSNKLKYLVLTANEETINQINLLDKFTNLVSFITTTFLLTIAGIAQKSQDVQEFLMELHYKTSSKGILEEENLPKKVKDQ